MNQATKERTLSQHEKILQLLRNAGSKGVTNVELQKIASRFNARIQEMYVEGYKIETEQFDSGITRYTLISEPKVKNRKPKAATDLLASEIESKYRGKISKDELLNLLEDMDLTVRRKINTYKK
jgi:hypothetical protein